MLEISSRAKMFIIVAIVDMNSTPSKYQMLSMVCIHLFICIFGVIHILRNQILTPECSILEIPWFHHSVWFTLCINIRDIM